ncbi:MAG: acireductone dioxygenase, partial [Planctomycetaceae bacterium]
MATVTVPAEARRISGLEAVRAFLADHGIHHEIWPLEDRVDPAAPAERILAAYAPEIDELKARGGFVTADVIDVYPDTPNLDAMLAKFAKEHTH